MNVVGALRHFSHEVKCNHRHGTSESDSSSFRLTFWCYSTQLDCGMVLHPSGLSSVSYPGPAGTSPRSMANAKCCVIVESNFRGFSS